MRIRSPEDFSAFEKALESVGAHHGNFYAAKLYEGPEARTQASLEMRVGLFSWQPLVLTQRIDVARRLGRYISNLPLCRTWRFRAVHRNATVGAGIHSLLEVDRIVGEDRPGIEAVLREYDCDDNEVRELLGVSEKLLGYIPWQDEKSASSVAHLLFAGAASPCSPAEAAAMREQLVGVVNMRNTAASIFKILGGIMFVVFGFMATFVECAILTRVAGFWGVVVGIMALPVALIATPWYALVAWGNWLPLAIIYGGGVVTYALLRIGSIVGGERE